MHQAFETYKKPAYTVNAKNTSNEKLAKTKTKIFFKNSTIKLNFFPDILLHEPILEKNVQKFLN